jgi:hypothetical protein
MIRLIILPIGSNPVLSKSFLCCGDVKLSVADHIADKPF